MLKGMFYDVKKSSDDEKFMHDNISPFVCKKELNHRYKAQQ